MRGDDPPQHVGKDWLWSVNTFSSDVGGFRSKTAAVVKVDQPKRNMPFAIGSRDVTLEQTPHSKIATDCAKIAFLARHVRTRALRADYFQIGEACQIAGNLILHSYREVSLS
jgi:hypothetical protein